MGVLRSSGFFQLRFIIHHLYDYFMSANTEEERISLMKDFIKAWQLGAYSEDFEGECPHIDKTDKYFDFVTYIVEPFSKYFEHLVNVRDCLILL